MPALCITLCMGVSTLWEISRRDISHSMDTTHTLNDLLLGKPEDERRFYIRGSGFVRLF